MRLLLAALLMSSPAWAQRNPNGDPSPTVQQQEKQADYARKGHPQSGKPKQERSALKTKDSGAKAPKSKPGESALRPPSK
jgi:hypothetical protein